MSGNYTDMLCLTAILHVHVPKTCLPLKLFNVHVPVTKTKGLSLSGSFPCAVITKSFNVLFVLIFKIITPFCVRYVR